MHFLNFDNKMGFAHLLSYEKDFHQKHTYLSRWQHR